jgi:hypothetical protein
MLNEQTNERPVPCISDLTFDEWHTGELSAARERELGAHVASCLRCATRERALRSEAAGYLQNPESGATLNRLFQHSARRITGPGRLVRSAAGVAAMLALGFVAWRAERPIEAGRPARELSVEARGRIAAGTRQKGGLQLGYFVKRGEAVYRGAKGEQLRPGDQLRFTLRPQRTGYLTILALDSRGSVSVYYPAKGSSGAAIVPTGDDLALEVATELDEQLGRETIFGLFCDRPVALDELRRRLVEARTLAAPLGCQMDIIVIQKTPA